MKLTRKPLAWTAAGALAVSILLGSLTGCGSSASTSASSEEAGIYTAGTYTSTAGGFGGDITVKMTFSASEITDVAVEGPGETEGIGSNAVEQLPEKIKEAQSAELGVQWKDTVTQPVGAMWRRGHNPGMPKGTEYVDVLGSAIQNQDGKIYYETTAHTLLTDDTGAVCGVECVPKVTLHCSKAVILATGGYANNLEMVQDTNNYWPSIPDDTGRPRTSWRPSRPTTAMWMPARTRISARPPSPSRWSRAPSSPLPASLRCTTPWAACPSTPALMCWIPRATPSPACMQRVRSPAASTAATAWAATPWPTA